MIRGRLPDRSLVPRAAQVVERLGRHLRRHRSSPRTCTGAHRAVRDTRRRRRPGPRHRRHEAAALRRQHAHVHRAAVGSERAARAPLAAAGRTRTHGGAGRPSRPCASSSSARGRRRAATRAAAPLQSVRAAAAHTAAASRHAPDTTSYAHSVRLATVRRRPFAPPNGHVSPSGRTRHASPERPIGGGIQRSRCSVPAVLSACGTGHVIGQPLSPKSRVRFCTKP